MSLRMRTWVQQIPLEGKTVASIRALVVESEPPQDDTPVLLFLHGKSEASQYLNELPLVCNHLSPPFQVILGRLGNVVVVAPQAPHSPNDRWNWRSYTTDLGRFLTTRFGRRTLIATGFSRGGLGVLQLARDFPDLISKWAIIDPQRAADDTEEQALLPAPVPCNEGWLRYGRGIPENEPFGYRLNNALNPRNSRFVAMGHGELALAAYCGERLEGPENLYEFLHLDYQ